MSFANPFAKPSYVESLATCSLVAAPSFLFDSGFRFERPTALRCARSVLGYDGKRVIAVTFEEQVSVHICVHRDATELAGCNRAFFLGFCFTAPAVVWLRAALPKSSRYCRD